MKLLIVLFFFNFVCLTPSSAKREFCTPSRDCTPPAKCYGYPDDQHKGMCVAIDENSNHNCADHPADPDGPYACKNNTRCVDWTEVVDGGYSYSWRCVPIVDQIGQECWNPQQCYQKVGYHDSMDCDNTLDNPVCICRWCIKGDRKDNKCNPMPDNCRNPRPEECPNSSGCDHY